MQVTLDLESAIKRSVSHTEIVRVPVPSISEALGEIYLFADEYGHTETNEGNEDVWGNTDEGDSFRLLLVEEGNEN